MLVESSKIITTEESRTYLQGIKLTWKCKLIPQIRLEKPAVLTLLGSHHVLSSYETRTEILFISVWNSTYEHPVEREKITDNRGCYKYTYDHTTQSFCGKTSNQRYKHRFQTLMSPVVFLMRSGNSPVLRGAGKRFRQLNSSDSSTHLKNSLPLRFWTRSKGGSAVPDMHHHECVCACHLALSYKQGPEHHRNSDAAISHSSPFSLLINKPKAAHILHSRRGLSLGAHMKALWLCFALACFQCQTASGLPRRIPQTPAPGGEPAGLQAAHILAAQGPTLRLSVRVREDPPSTVRWMASLLRVCFAGELWQGLALSGGCALCACHPAARAPGNGGTGSQTCLFGPEC